MNDVISFFSNNWLPIILFVFGIPITMISGAKFSNRKRISYHINTKKVYIDNAGKHNDKLKITYEGETVDTMYQTQIYLWNSGNQTIDKSDVVEPISVKMSNGKILDISFSAISRNQCGINYDPITIEESKITFDFLDKNDGAYIDVLHTDQLEFMTPTIKGTRIKNCKDISLYFNNRLKYKILLNTYNFILTILVFCLDYFLILSGIEMLNNIQSYEILAIGFFVAIFLFFMVLTFMFFRFYLPSQYANKVPLSICKGEK